MSRNFSLKELCHSDTAKLYGWDNIPDFEQVNRLNDLANYVLQSLRDMYGKAIHVTSGYRSEQVNRLVGGVVNSHHTQGYAADIVGHDKSVAETRKLFELLKTKGFQFTQLIWEHNASGSYWVHVSYVPGNLKCQVINNLLKQ